MTRARSRTRKLQMLGRTGPNPIPVVRAGPSPLLERFQQAARSLLREHLNGGAALKADETALAQDLYELFGTALRTEASGDSVQVAKMQALARKHLVPLLDTLPATATAIDAGWRALPGPQGGADVNRLLMAGVFPHTDEVSLRGMTAALMALTPANAPDLLATVGEHLRKPFEETDLVDLEMVSIVLPHALHQLRAAEDSGKGVAEIEGLIVSGLCFNTRSTKQYVAHFLEWMRQARAQGIPDPERRLGQLFRRQPAALPGIARFVTESIYGSNLINDTARLQTTPERQQSGVRGRLLQRAGWEGSATSAELPAQPMVEEAFQFLRSLRAPSPVTRQEKESPRLLLARLQRELPRVAQSELFSMTAQLLSREGGSDGYGREARALAARWRYELRTGSHHGEQRDMAYSAQAGMVPEHPWVEAADGLARLLDRLPPPRTPEP